ncbi:MAG: hypothetical protein GW795_07425 [Cyanobacteria bacterium]|nr:hypothetical protein [Cyanobacteria bacterium CG_2015-16_32_12]NCO77734.1 hypothetical protein [Cyanobacteria bacterium CG_2015-22_32_23]NCQ03037.1 hypothetical protein [Cyanobacteria bacterium CG_2015-09_32_10]NCQ41710.1 hypothetical protein [Cyanobacteria bacterium CG_2015-04_32_10]NCS83588.1 hypothetical protein [Cyanobacteria bacterium CG_2015-02_32_10]
MTGKKLKYWFLLLTTLLVSYWSQHLNIFPWQLFEDKSSSVVFAQNITIPPEKVADAVYQQLSYLPKENSYLRKETNNIAIDNTLISRLVRYHQYTKSRATIYRLDWKLTLADYLGKNEVINTQRYPGYSTLTQNPLDSDRKIIESLTMQQRNELVNLLVSIYNPNTEIKPTQKPSQNPQNTNSSPVFVLPTPGGADLLLP